MRSVRSQSVTTVALEAFFLVMAVFFALAVDEAWESHEQAEAAEFALQRIKLEVEHNRELIQSEHDSHNAEIVRLRAMIDQLSSGKSLLSDGNISPNINLSILRETAWESASLTGVLKNMPYDTVEDLTAVYSLQALYQQQSGRVFATSADVDFIEAAPEVQIRSIYQTFLTLYSLEEALLRAYDSVGGNLNTSQLEK